MVKLLEINLKNDHPKNIPRGNEYINKYKPQMRYMSTVCRGYNICD